MRPVPEGGWKKVLYWAQGDDDAHTTETFLEALVVNATVAKRSYAKVVWDSLPVNQQLSTVTLVATASYLLTQGHLTPAQLLSIQLLLVALGALLLSVCTLSLRHGPQRGGMALQARAVPKPAGGGCMAEVGPGCSTWCPGEGLHQRPGSGSGRELFLDAHPRAVQPSSNSSNGGRTAGRVGTSRPWSASPFWSRLCRLGRPLATCVLFVASTLLLSPVYATLAQSVSTDTVVFLSVALLTSHLFLWDYRFDGRVKGRSTGVSLGCAILASILCASRAGSAVAAFAQVLLSLEAYVLFPQLRWAVLAASRTANAALTLGLLCASVALLLPHSVLLATSCLCGAAFVSLICPMWLVRVGKFKAQINGPWDEAVPKLRHGVSLRVASPRRAAL